MADEDAEELARQAWLAIVRIFRSPETAELVAKAASAEDLPTRLFGVLLTLPAGRGQAKSMSQLAEECFSTRSYMTVVVDGLEQRGLVRRRTDPDDRRVKLVELTGEGLAALERSHERLSQPPSGLRDLPRDDLATLRDLLARAAAPYPW